MDKTTPDEVLLAMEIVEEANSEEELLLSTARVEEATSEVLVDETTSIELLLSTALVVNGASVDMVVTTTSEVLLLLLLAREVVGDAVGAGVDVVHVSVCAKRGPKQFRVSPIPLFSILNEGFFFLFFRVFFSVIPVICTLSTKVLVE